MKDLFLRKKIALLSVLAGGLYIWMLVFPIWDDWKAHKMSFLLGWGVDGYENQDGLVGEASFEVIDLRVSPKENLFLFPEKMETEKREAVDTRFSKMKIVLPESSFENAHIKTMERMSGVIVFIMFLLYVVLPFRFFKMISLLQKGHFFDRQNVKLIRQIGFIMLAVYLGDYFFKYLSWRINLALFDFENYEIVQSGSDPVLLVIGVVALLLAEVFARGVLLEEDRRLTI